MHNDLPASIWTQTGVFQDCDMHHESVSPVLYRNFIDSKATCTCGNAFGIRLDHGDEWTHSCGMSYRLFGNALYIYERPKPEADPEPVAWDGEGLPPVGVECEYSCVTGGHECDNWFKCEVLDIGQRGFTIISHHLKTDGDFRVQFFKACNIKFRPIKTERGKVYEFALKQLWKEYDAVYQSQAVQDVMNQVVLDLYDAGMLKMPEGE